MRALVTIVATAAVAFAMGTIRHGRASAQDVSATAATSAAETNDLLRRRCVVCHNTATPLGGLNLQLFDAAKPDPGAALMMSVKVSRDAAMFAAGDPAPSRETIDEFVRAMRASADENEHVSGPWIIDLEEDPRDRSRGHAVIVARKRSDAGEVRLTCYATRHQFEATPPQPRT